MKLFVILVLLLCFVSVGYSQQSLPDNPKARDKYIRCYQKDSVGKGVWVKIKNNLSKREIRIIQERLIALDYDVVKTGVYDFQTKRELEKFNLISGLYKYSGVLDGTMEKLKQAFKARSKQTK